MNLIPHSRRCAVLAGAFTLSFLSALGEEPLRYQFPEGSTNGYKVILESPGELDTRKYEGVVVLIVKSADEEGASIQLSGQLLPRQVPGVPAFMPRHPMNDPWRIYPLHQFSEARVDARGRVLRTTGIPELPKLLLNYAELLFPELPKDSSGEWEMEAAMKVQEDAPGMGRHPGMPHRPFPMGPFGAGELSGTRRDMTKILETGPDSVRMQKEFHFESWWKTGDEPRLEVTTQSEILFDPQTGALESLELEGKSVSSTLEYLHRTPLRVTVKRLQGEELARALKSGPSPMARVTDEEFPALLEDLTGDDQERRSEAARRLMISDPGQRFGDELLEVVKPFIFDEDDSLQRLAALVLVDAATAEEVPLLLKLLNNEDRGHHHDAIAALQRLKDPRAVEPLAELIAKGSSSAHLATVALGEFGPAAEPVALQLLGEKHLQTRRLACDILGRCGTGQSIEALQEVIAEGESNLLHTAAEAIRAIKDRSAQAEKLIF